MATPTNTARLTITWPGSGEGTPPFSTSFFYRKVSGPWVLDELVACAAGFMAQYQTIVPDTTIFETCGAITSNNAGNGVLTATVDNGTEILEIEQGGFFNGGDPAVGLPGASLRQKWLSARTGNQRNGSNFIPQVIASAYVTSTGRLTVPAQQDAVAVFNALYAEMLSLGFQQVINHKVPGSGTPGTYTSSAVFGTSTEPYISFLNRRYK